jgi:hypothetical protein
MHWLTSSAMTTYDAVARNLPTSVVNTQQVFLAQVPSVTLVSRGALYTGNTQAPRWKEASSRFVFLP